MPVSGVEKPPFRSSCRDHSTLPMVGNYRHLLWKKKSRPDTHSNQMGYTLPLREGLMAIEREQKENLALLFL